MYILNDGSSDATYDYEVEIFLSVALLKHFRTKKFCKKIMCCNYHNINRTVEHSILITSTCFVIEMNAYVYLFSFLNALLATK